MPVVRVIMPSYNHDELIRETIEIIPKQNSGDIRLIIVDNAPTDISRIIIQE